MRSLLPLLLALGPSALAAPPPALVQSITHPHARWAFQVDARQAVAVDYDGGAAVRLPRPGSPRAVKLSGKRFLNLAVSREWGWLAVTSGEGRLNIYRLPEN